MKRILITLLLASCFAESGLAMDVYKEPNEDPQEELNEQLVWAIQWRNSDKITGLPQVDKRSV